MKEYLDILYKQAGDKDLYLDLYMPDAENPPLILWIHGGGWSFGDRKSPIMLWQVDRGYALASVEYRLSDEKTKGGSFPGNIIDCKDALIYLRQNAAKYGYDSARVIAAGDSAGGHLAALMGTSAGHADWEPEGTDCSVQAVVDYYGAVSVANVKDWPACAEDDMPVSLIAEGMLGAPIRSVRGRMKAAAANPITYISGNEPPFLILHGDSDTVVPYVQSVYLRDALEAAGGKVALHRVFGGDHCFESAVANKVVDGFLDYLFK